MMPQLIEILECTPGPRCTREQARELLEGLRAAYRSLLPAERALVKSVVWQAGRTRVAQEID
jgi:hypothetical protein